MKEIRCKRKACQAVLGDIVATHRDTKEKYCIKCARMINRACNQEVVTW